MIMSYEKIPTPVNKRHKETIYGFKNEHRF